MHPHKIQYYLERRDPEFDAQMVQVLHVYKEVEIWREKGAPPPDLVAVLSYDEKPGIQAIENTAPDLPPVSGKYSAIGRDHEYIRHGTLSLLAGIDLLSGEVLGLVRVSVLCSTIIPHTSPKRLALSWPRCQTGLHSPSRPNTGPGST